jgi:hypothetical protein
LAIVSIFLETPFHETLKTGILWDLQHGSAHEGAPIISFDTGVIDAEGLSIPSDVELGMGGVTSGRSLGVFSAPLAIKHANLKLVVESPDERMEMGLGLLDACFEGIKHFPSESLTPVGNGFPSGKFFIYAVEDRTKSLIALGIVPIIDTGGTIIGKEIGDILNVPLDSVDLQGFAKQTIGGAQVLGIHAQLKGGTAVVARGPGLIQGQIVSPAHIDGEEPIV